MCFRFVEDDDFQPEGKGVGGWGGGGMCVPNDEFSVLVCQILSKRCKYTTSVDIQQRKKKKKKKKRYKKLFTHVESHASAVSLLESGE